MGVDRVSEAMERYAGGEREVFECLYDLMAPRLYRFCRRLAIRQAEAEDVFQETFLRIHRARTTYVPGANALHWAFAIARSVHRDRLRYRRRHPEELGSAASVPEPDRPARAENASPEVEARARDLVAVVALELGRMSERNRSAYVLLQEEGLSVREAAAVLGATTDAVKQRAHRASEQLRRAVHAAGWKEGAHDRPWNPLPSPA